MQQRWPERLWIVRHGESAGNLAREAAYAAGLHRVDVAGRDVDVPLSPLGEKQACALGDWFAKMPPDERPDVVLSSPYLRAERTAELIQECGGVSDDLPEFTVDERLREREAGILDRLTASGVNAFHPDQADFRRILGKFYHRPPGGESWCDVILRLRSAMDTIALHYGGRRVLLVGHQVVVLCLRYLLENLSEAELLAIDRAGEVANCGVTEYRFDPKQGKDGRLALHQYNLVTPLEQAGAPITVRREAIVAAR